MATATVLTIESVGFYPNFQPFDVSGAQQIFMVSGSVYLKAGQEAQMIGVDVLIDDVVVGTPEICANKSNIHMATVTKYITLNLAQGSHKMAFRKTNDVTLFNEQDTLNVLIMDMG